MLKFHAEMLIQEEQSLPQAINSPVLTRSNQQISVPVDR
jgi:hypothetical protein